MSNHLVNASSPYLLQHANNPVDWYPWNAEALEKARLENKPIFLSIGYAACHWCHVMAHESFEDPDVAAIMNAHFVNIKVDREERPDLDSIFMSFVAAITGQGGWPMSVFLTPEGKPFYGGTYFPPRRSHNLPAFGELLETIARLWKEDRSRLISSAEELNERLKTPSREQGGAGEIDLPFLQQVIKTLASAYDWKYGGWGGAPKFPQPMLIEFLLQQGSRGDQSSVEIATHVLTAMRRGGLYDLLGGGFSRYSVEPTWLIPHFEKMLYDNAQLARVYLHAFQLTGDPAFRSVCEATLDFVLREMTHPEGGFFSSLDADSEGEEGKFYLWTMEEIQEAIPDPVDAELFMRAYGVSQAGNFEGKNILRRIEDEHLASELQLDSPDVKSKLDHVRSQLFKVRSLRVRPNTDDKVLVSWNALMLSTFAEAGRALSREDYLNAAIHNATFMLEKMVVDGRLMRSWREGVANHNAYLEDHAGLALAFISLYQRDPDPKWFQAAKWLVEEILEHFADPAGGFFDTRDDHETLLYRPKDLQDNAIPSGNALAATALLILAAYEGRSEWLETVQKMLASNMKMIQRYPTAFGQWLSGADFSVGPVAEVAIIGAPDGLKTTMLLNPLWTGYRPRMILASSAQSQEEGGPALLKDRQMLNNQPTAYVCQNFLCRQPVNTPEEMLEQLDNQ